MKIVRLMYALLFRGFAGPEAIAGSSGPWEEDNPNMAYS